MRPFFRLLGRLAGPHPDRQQREAAAPDRRPSSGAAAVALAGGAGDGSVETVLRALVHGVSSLTGAAAVLAIVGDDGTLERLAASGADGCVRETFTRPDVLVVLVERLRSLGRPILPADLDPGHGALLDAVVPRGFVALPVGADVRGVLVLIEPDAASVLDDAGLEAASVLAAVAGESLAGIGRATSLWGTCEELRRLAAHLLARRDRESEDVAHQLHEGLCQQLAAANAELRAVEHIVEDDPRVRERVRDARRLVSGTIGELREVAQRLRPAMLEDMGYVQALRWYTGRLREQTGMALSLEVRGEERRLPFAVESALYRATEEVLAGARGPSALHVCYRHEPEGVQLEIAGTAPGAVELAAMRERLRPFRGTVRVTAPPDAPPVVAFELPVN